MGVVLYGLALPTVLPLVSAFTSCFRAVSRQTRPQLACEVRRAVIREPAAGCASPTRRRFESIFEHAVEQGPSVSEAKLYFLLPRASDRYGQIIARLNALLEELPVFC